MHSTPSTLKRLLELEWGMFSKVKNVGGQASCQTDKASFEVMRKSQARSLSPEVLESWLKDLEEAHRAGRNLMTEKYAWMMESTAPEEFAHIAHMLPPLDDASLHAIEEILASHVTWKEHMEQQYPCLAKCGRPLRTSEDSPWNTSFETYLRGELKTCSPKTLALWLQLVRAQAQAHINAAELTLLYQAECLGYTSLSEAEHSLRQSCSPRE